MGVQQFSTKFSVPAGERLFIDCGGVKKTGGSAAWFAPEDWIPVYGLRKADLNT
jgi:hypothetical protein